MRSTTSHFKLKFKNETNQNQTKKKLKRKQPQLYLETNTENLEELFPQRQIMRRIMNLITPPYHFTNYSIF